MCPHALFLQAQSNIHLLSELKKIITVMHQLQVKLADPLPQISTV